MDNLFCLFVDFYIPLNTLCCSVYSIFGKQSTLLVPIQTSVDWPEQVCALSVREFWVSKCCKASWFLLIFRIYTIPWSELRWRFWSNIIRSNALHNIFFLSPFIPLSSVSVFVFCPSHYSLLCGWSCYNFLSCMEAHRNTCLELNTVKKKGKCFKRCNNMQYHNIAPRHHKCTPLYKL